MQLQKSYTIPFCYLPNSKTQTFTPETCKRSDFQIQQLLQVSQREDFAYFVVCGISNPVIVAEEFECAFNIMWYDKFNNMHYARLGMRKMLGTTDWNVIKATTPPVGLDAIVYKSHCN